MGNIIKFELLRGDMPLSVAFCDSHKRETAGMLENAQGEGELRASGEDDRGTVQGPSVASVSA